MGRECPALWAAATDSAGASAARAAIGDALACAASLVCELRAADRPVDAAAFERRALSRARADAAATSASAARVTPTVRIPRDGV